VLEKLLEEGDVVLFQLEVPLATVREALRISRSKGAVTLLNPAPYRELDEDILKAADYLTPNETELEQLVGQPVGEDSALQEALVRWESLHAVRLVVTRGARGCAYVADGQLKTVAPLKVEAVDTVGAGDAFNGGLAHGLCKGWDLDAAVAFAVRVSSLAVTRFGAQEGMPTLDEVEATMRADGK
jgi:ribokinase